MKTTTASLPMLIEFRRLELRPSSLVDVVWFVHPVAGCLVLGRSLEAVDVDAALHPRQRYAAAGLRLLVSPGFVAVVFLRTRRHVWHLVTGTRVFVLHEIAKLLFIPELRDVQRTPVATSACAKGGCGLVPTEDLLNEIAALVTVPHLPRNILRFVSKQCVSMKERENWV